MISPVSSSSVPEQLWLRLLRLTLAFGLVIVCTALAVLAVVGCLPSALGRFAYSISCNNDFSNIPISQIGLFIFAILLPLILFVIAAYKHWLRWTVLTIGWLIILAVLCWLAWDEPVIRQPLTMEELSPPFSGAEQSFVVLMQYSSETPSAEAKAFAKINLSLPLSSPLISESRKWTDFVMTNRTKIEENWAALAPQRRWVNELAAFDRIGDLTPPDLNANIMSFKPWRSIVQHTCAFASLQAVDGLGDDATATLVPLLEVSRKLQLSSRTLIRTQIAYMAERMILETSSYVLEYTPVSVASRARLLEALGTVNAPALARQLIFMEYAQFPALSGGMKLGDFYVMTHNHQSFLREPLNFLSPILINPKATRNSYGDIILEIANFAATRDLDKLSAREKIFADSLDKESGMKNVGGRLLLITFWHPFKYLAEMHWKNADSRTTLLKRLGTSP